MALFLQELYEETRKAYQLELICGKQGLQNMMNWVYISEDIATTSFLQGGELIITTGITSQRQENWLYDFIYALIQKNTCGLILNIGRYLQPEDITENIRILCEHHQYPLFLMPWETRIFDITHDYYHRIFQETQTRQAITDAFFSIIRGTQNIQEHAAFLTEHGYPMQQNYQICDIHYAISAHLTEPSERIHSRLEFALEKHLKSTHPTFHLCCLPQHFLILAPSGKETVFYEHILVLLERLSLLYPELSFYCGIGSTAHTFHQLPKSYFHANSAASMARYKKKILFSFQQMGFFKILLSVNDPKILEDYVRERLGPVIAYDLSHNSNYQETLYQYLLHNGSIQKIAAALFCHRNTINYRIHILKDELQYNLENVQVRCELMTAYWIQEYLTQIQH